MQEDKLGNNPPKLEGKLLRLKEPLAELLPPLDGSTAPSFQSFWLPGSISGGIEVRAETTNGVRDAQLEPMRKEKGKEACVYHSRRGKKDVGWTIPRQKAFFLGT